MGANGKSGNVDNLKEGVHIRGDDPERQKRLAQITERKVDLKTEREALLREREELRREMTNDNYYLRHNRVKLNAFKQKSVDLDSRIEKFGSELKSLNEEEADILGSRQQTH